MAIINTSARKLISVNLLTLLNMDARELIIWVFVLALSDTTKKIHFIQHDQKCLKVTNNHYTSIIFVYITRWFCKNTNVPGRQHY